MIASPLLNNAVASIRMGIEDFASNSPDRSLSAVRNFYAGVLLLAKEVLVRTAPGVHADQIIGERYKPAPDGSGGVLYLAEGNRTIDFNTIETRFKDFKLDIDHKALRDLNRIRNEIEHRYTDKPDPVVRETIAKGFPVVARLLRQAHQDPAALLGDAWPVMLEEKSHYESERSRCRASLKAIRWHSATIEEAGLLCEDCGSDLLEQSNASNDDQLSMELTCQSCGAKPDAEDAIEYSLNEALWAEGYIRFKDAGEDGPIYDCPSCGRAAYVDTEAGCALCGYEFGERKCARCFAPIPLSEAISAIEDGFCSYCSYLVSKDD